MLLVMDLFIWSGATLTPSLLPRVSCRTALGSATQVVCYDLRYIKCLHSPITIEYTTPLNVKTQPITDPYSQQLLEKMLLVLLDYT